MSPEFQQLCEVAAAWPFEHAEKAWRALLAALRLSLGYQPALERALQQSAWRTAEDPGKYLRTVCYRIAERMGLKHAAPGPGRRRGVRVGGAYDDMVVPEFIDLWGLFDCDVRWDLVGERLGMTEDQVIVLEARADGLTRREILAEAENDEEMRSLASAYRQVSLRLGEIRALLSGEPENISPRNFPKTPRTGYVEGRGEK